MSVSNLSDFSDSQFNAYDWINSSMEMMGKNEDMDSFLSGLSMKIQILAQDCGDTIESQMGSLLDKLPNMVCFLCFYYCLDDSNWYLRKRT